MPSTVVYYQPDTDHPNGWTETVPDPRPLDVQKTYKLAAIQRRKALALAGMPFTFGGVDYVITISADDRDDVAKTAAQLAAAPSGTTVRWEIVNNVFVDMTLDGLTAMVTKGETYVPAIFANVDSLVGQVNAATDAATLDAIDETSGWPS